MNYIFKNDLSYILTKRKTIISIYLLISIAYAIYNTVYLKVDNSDLIFLNLGMKYDTFLEINFYLFKTLFYIYIGISLYTNDLKMGNDNIFLRISTSKWNFLKSLSIMIISIIIVFFSDFLIYCVTNFNLIYILIDWLYIISIINACLILLKAYYLKKLLLIFIILTCIIIFLLEQPYMYIQKPLVLISMCLFFTGTNFIIRNVIKLFERSC